MDRRRGGPDDAAVVQALFDDAIALHRRVRDVVPPAIVSAAGAMIEAFAAGGKVLAFGNGGSATDAQHLAAELVGRFERERAGVAAIALTTDGGVLTSIANDDAFGRVFARQVEALGRRGDVALGISTSGNSANVLAALETARERGLTTIALTGRDGGAIGKLAAIHIHVEDSSTARVQEVHRTVIHAICTLVEMAL
jgi:D-sedoheptulose 7-phosphate isomerase